MAVRLPSLCQPSPSHSTWAMMILGYCGWVSWLRTGVSYRLIPETEAASGRRTACVGFVMSEHGYPQRPHPPTAGVRCVGDRFRRDRTATALCLRHVTETSEPRRCGIESVVDHFAIAVGDHGYAILETLVVSDRRVRAPNTKPPTTVIRSDEGPLFDLYIDFNAATVNVSGRPRGDPLRITTKRSNLSIRRGIRFEVDVGLSVIGQGSPRLHVCSARNNL